MVRFRTYHAAAALVAAASACPVAAQVVSPAQRVDRDTQLRELPIERREIHDIPANMVRFGDPAGWSGATRLSGKQRGALAAERRRGDSRRPCASWYDWVDLKRVRANGFRLVGYSAAPVAAAGFNETQPLEAIAIETAVSTDRPQMNLPAADGIRIRPPLHGAPGPRGLMRCYSGYRLTITLEGPRGIDPYRRLGAIKGWRKPR